MSFGREFRHLSNPSELNFIGHLPVLYEYSFSVFDLMGILRVRTSTICITI